MMRELTPQEVEYVYRRIAGHEKCATCGKWCNPREFKFGKYCSKCIPNSLNIELYEEMIENAKAQSVFRKVIENESSKIGSKSVS